jgi:hypothetical protein
VTGILREPARAIRHGAWASFLELISPVILQVIRLFERDEDPSATATCSSAST